MSRFLSFVGLVATWCILWSGFSIANLLSGTVVSLVLLVGLGVRESNGVRINLVALVTFALLVAKDAVLSTVAVASEILTPTDYTDELVTSVQLPSGAETHLLLLTIVVTLTPGTAVVDSDPTVPSVTIHLLHADREEATRAHIIELAELAMTAWSVTNPSHEVST